jgi:hypothetical protein
MKFRGLPVVALVLALAAVGAWVWFGREKAAFSTPDVQGPSGTPEGAGNPPANAVANQPGTTAPPMPASTPEAVKPSERTQIATAVVPGLPIVRTTPVPASAIAKAGQAGGRPTATPQPEPEGKAELENVQNMLRDFRNRMGENPVGSNAEIMKAVMGGNPVSARLGPPQGQSLNGEGELVDRWGTPYFFHQLSKDSMEVRSAGPDRKMWTADDLVGK